MLRANTSLATRIAANGRRLALRQMSMERTLDYMLSLLGGYAAAQRYRASSAAGYERASTASELGKIAAQCKCNAPPANSKPTAARCGVAASEFRSGIRAGKYRCCE